MIKTAGDSDVSIEDDAAWLARQCRAPARDGVVYLHSPTWAFQAPGGGENQLVRTARGLEELGRAPRLFVPWVDRLERGRLLHLFGMSREGLDLARVARARGIKVVVSPICWYEPAAIRALEPAFGRRLVGLAGYHARSAAPWLPSWRRELLMIADAVLPNSRAEARQLIRLFGLDPSRIHVIPNAVSPGLLEAGPELFWERIGRWDFVFFAGRLEPRKNPLGLIQALARSGLPIVIAGDAPAGQEAYARRCREAGGDRVHWLGRLAADDPLLASAYRAARVFALPSWFETPGLAALEAALAGLPVVVTPHGSTREYFGDLAAYARPDSPTEIARAVERSWNEGADPRLARRIADHYLWPQTAQLTAEVHDQITE